jgi:hypothetical protein
MSVRSYFGEQCDEAEQPRSHRGLQSSLLIVVISSDILTNGYADLVSLPQYLEPVKQSLNHDKLAWGTEACTDSLEIRNHDFGESCATHDNRPEAL